MKIPRLRRLAIADFYAECDITPTQLFPRPANPHEYWLSLYGTSNLPSYLPSKNKRFDWRGRCTRFVRRLLFHINHQLSSGSGSPSESLHPTFFHSRTSIKQRFLITKRYTSSVFQPMKPKVKRMPAPTTLFLARPMATFTIEFLLLHFTLNSSPRGKQACR